MKPFEIEIENIKKITFEMLDLVKDQISLTKEALLTGNQELSCEIMRKEKKVNAYELSIERECEEFLAMQHPVASDLRFTISILKITGNLERIGDHAYRISSFVFDDLMKLNKELITMSSLHTLFDEIDTMLDHVNLALEVGDSQLAKKVFKQDKILDKVNKSAHKLLSEYAKTHIEDLNNLFLLSKTVSKLERVGDLIKNIAEDILFYHDSKVVKHKKKNKRIDKKLGEE
ncbi:MAG: phosphate signaling complex protein PhoU [Salinivirgaceae bacterium]|jgi:phosphate transport system protein|nr:phosphate signaling complex protein PhoU [Salinivirgaceae bacterium]